MICDLGGDSLDFVYVVYFHHLAFGLCHFDLEGELQLPLFIVGIAHQIYDLVNVLWLQFALQKETLLKDPTIADQNTFRMAVETIRVAQIVRVLVIAI